MVVQDQVQSHREWTSNLMKIWTAINSLNTSIKEIREIVKIKKHFNKESYDKESMVKLKFLTQKISDF